MCVKPYGHDGPHFNAGFGDQSASPSLDRPTLERAIEAVNGLLLEVRNQREYGMGYQNAVRDAAFKLEQLRDDAETRL